MDDHTHVACCDTDTYGYLRMVLVIKNPGTSDFLCLSSDLVITGYPPYARILHSNRYPLLISAPPSQKREHFLVIRGGASVVSGMGGLWLLASANKKITLVLLLLRRRRQRVLLLVISTTPATTCLLTILIPQISERLNSFQNQI